MLLISKSISTNLLKNKETYYPLIACTLTLPFVSLGYIIKGYFYGRQNIKPHMISNVLEQTLKLSIIIFLLPKIIKYGKIATITIFILINIITESFSIIILLLFLPKKIVLKKEDFKPNLLETKEILNISLPSISGRLLSNICYFFEPVILTNTLLSKGISAKTITTQYGIYNAYSLSLLIFPTFFITSISNAIIPEISKELSKKNYKKIKRTTIEILIISIIIGITCTSFITIFSQKLLYLLYKTKEGILYIKILAPFFILLYLETPLSSILIGLNKIKTTTFISVSGSIIKLLFLYLLCNLNFSFYSLIIAEIINIIYVTLLQLITLKKELNKFNS